MSGHSDVTDYLLEGKDPDAIALWMLQGAHTYGELERTVRQMAAALVHEPRGKRVLLIGDNSLFWVAAYLGIMKAGLIAVPLPTGVSAADLAYIVELTEAQTVFVQARYRQRFEPQLAAVRVFTEKNEFDAPIPNVWPLVKSEDLAALMFTSGSTGRPRGVMITHANIMANTESIIQYLQLTASDRIMTVLPFHYCFGTSLLHTHLRAGGSLVIDPRFLYPEVVLQRMEEMHCTGFAGVPSHFQILLRRSSLKKRSFPHLRYVQQAGGHLAPVFIRELRIALPDTQVFIMYGQTEATARLSYLPPELLDSKPGSIGKGIPGVRLQVLNEKGEVTGPGEVGEIVAEGENVARGYWHAPDESERSFRDGKLYTGDLATVDRTGFLYIVDRSKDFLKCGGTRVSCRQIEDQLLENDSLLEAAVIGILDQVLGEAVKAFVVPQDSRCSGMCRWQACRDARQEIFRFCRQQLPTKVVPREIVMLPALPKNSAGKNIKALLKAQ